MLRLTLAQMRRSVGRLTAAGVAILIGTAFLTATLLAGDALTRTTYDALTTTFADADLVVASSGGLTPADLAAVRAVPHVDALETGQQLGIELAGPGGRAWAAVRTGAEDPRLESASTVAGELPTADDEIALPAGVAERLGVAVGDTVTVRTTVVPEGGAGPGVPEGGAGPVVPAGGEPGVAVPLPPEPEVHEEQLAVVGLLEDGASELLGLPGSAIVQPWLLDRWQDLAGDAEAYVDAALVAVTDGAAVPDVQHAIGEVLEGSGTTVRTQDEHAQVVVGRMTGQTEGLTAVVLAFGAVALLVAALVIANTFGVLVAQRTRTLALLRCVGADRRQLRRSVVVESVILGLAASVAGVIAGTAVVQAVLTVLGGRTDVPVPSTVSFSAAAVLVPLLAGLSVTVVAALAPARAATRVSPLAALAPVAPPDAAERSGRVRAWLAALLTAGGATALAVGMVATVAVDPVTGLGIAVLGGAVSFVGVLVGAVFWVPRVVGVLGRGSTRAGGAAARLAAANSVRNPRRTSATSAALLIGVTLVATMATGAASIRSALNEALDERFAVDVSVVGSGGAAGTGLPPGFVSAVEAVDGVLGGTEVIGAPLQVTWGSDAGGGGEASLDALGVDVVEATGLVRAPQHLTGLEDGSVLVPTQMTLGAGVPEEGTVTLTGSAGEPVTLDVVLTPLESDAMLLSRETLERLSPGAPVTGLWLTLTDVDRATEVVTAIEDAVAQADVSAWTSGAAVERAFYQRVVDTLLAVVVGLLAVAVVIALIGVANTLSLSVVERRRESATLRAIGLSRRQLRGTLAVEGVLIALVGALAGSALGLLYGWAGAWTVLGELADVRPVVPWGHLAIVVAVAVLAGLLASVLPGRSAARTSPVEALAVD